MREQFDEIYNSVMNGQHKQAVEQFNALPSGEDRAICLSYIHYNLDQPVAALQLMLSVVI